MSSEVTGLAAGTALLTKNPVLRAAFKALLQEVCRSAPMEGLPYPVFVRNRGWLRALDDIVAQVPGMDVYLQHVAQDGEHIAVSNALTSGFRSMTTGFDDEVIAAASHILSVIRDYRERHGAIIEVTDALESMLLASDIDDLLPMDLLALPYPNQYVCFGKVAREQLRVGIGGLAGFEPHGCFCVQMPCQGGAGYALTIYTVLVTSDGRNKTITFMHSPVADCVTPLKDWVARIAAKHAESMNSLQDSLRLTSYLAKVFLYLGMKGARTQHLKEYTELSARLDRVEPKKQGKLGRRLQRLYDRIVVGPDSLPQDLRQGPGAHGVSQHWRRGHFRMQSHGHAHALRKLIFVRPMLVAANPADPQEGLAPKTYSIRH